MINFVFYVLVIVSLPWVSDTISQAHEILKPSIGREKLVEIIDLEVALIKPPHS